MYPPNKPFLDRDTNSSLGDNGCRYVDPTEHDFKKEGNKTSKVRQYSRQTPNTRSEPGELKRDPGGDHKSWFIFSQGLI